jgi:hypothetical protein
MEISPGETTSNSLEFPSILKGKKLLLATESFGPVNGVSRTTLNLVTYLRSQGVNVAVVAPEISTGADSTHVVASPPSASTDTDSTPAQKISKSDFKATLSHTTPNYQSFTLYDFPNYTQEPSKAHPISST